MLTDLIVELLLELLLCISLSCFGLGDLSCELGEAKHIEVREGLLFRASEEDIVLLSAVDFTAAGK